MTHSFKLAPRHRRIPGKQLGATRRQCDDSNNRRGRARDSAAHESSPGYCELALSSPFLPQSRFKKPHCGIRKRSGCLSDDVLPNTEIGFPPTPPQRRARAVTRFATPGWQARPRTRQHSRSGALSAATHGVGRTIGPHWAVTLEGAGCGSVSPLAFGRCLLSVHPFPVLGERE